LATLGVEFQEIESQVACDLDRRVGANAVVACHLPSSQDTYAGGERDISADKSRPGRREPVLGELGIAAAVGFPGGLFFTPMPDFALRSVDGLTS
jgi:hypothetical protein